VVRVLVRDQDRIGADGGFALAEAARVDDQDPLLTSFGRLVEAYSAIERWLGSALETECGIAHTWFEVLLRLDRSDEQQLTMGALAAQVALTSGGVTRLSDRMIEAGLVERRPSPTDRRVAFIALTPSGRDKIEHAATVVSRELRSAFGGLRAAELRNLDALLDRLRDDHDPPRTG
jgi:DNA-binding MarR family transcriptional regulator